MHVSEVDTPALVVDLDALEQNIARMQRYCDAHGIKLRPHIKTHKTIAIAQMQMAAGACGIACQKLGEAEVMVNAGIEDVLIPYNILGAQKLDRLMRLSRRATITVAADSEYTVQGISDAARADGATIHVIVELDIHTGRCGVRSPEAARDLARKIAELPGLTFCGVMTMPSRPEMNPFLQRTLELLDEVGLPHPIVSGGSTPTSFLSHQVYGLTEIRVGEYIFGGLNHLLSGWSTEEQCALNVHTTVVSRPTPDRAILDGGSKTFSAVVRQTPDGPSMGYIREYPEARFRGASEEHGAVDVSACPKKPKIGERVRVIPAHVCPCVNEHDEMVAGRNGKVEAIWPISARGKVR